MDATCNPDIDFDACLGPNPDEPVYGGLTRRELLKFCAGIAATMGLSASAGVRMAEAAVSPARPPVIWLHGQECTGCTESLLRAYHPTLEALLLDVISLDYHDTLCVGAGHQALAYKHAMMEKHKGKYVLVTEGGTPMKDGGIYCKVGGKTSSRARARGRRGRGRGHRHRLVRVLGRHPIGGPEPDRRGRHA